MQRKSWRSLLFYIFFFSVVWFFILPVTLRGWLRNCFFKSQIPVFKLTAEAHHRLVQNSVKSYSKHFWMSFAQELLRENAYLRLQLTEKQNMFDLAQRILKLNQINCGEKFRCLTARVIFRSIELWDQIVVIDKGFNAGVRVGQGVICADGVVGRVRQVEKSTAVVELITCLGFKMIVKMENRSEPYVLNGIVNTNLFGKSSPLAKLINVDQADEFVCPQKIETVECGQQFPSNVFVGQLEKVDRKENETVGVVRLGDYLKWIDEVGVLIPVSNLL